MSQHKTKHIIYITFLAALAVAFSLAGCRDDIIYSPVDIPDGEVEISADIMFKPLIPLEIKTRAEAPNGDAYKGINSLYVFFFKPSEETDGSPVKVEEYSGKIQQGEGIDKFQIVNSEDGNIVHATFKRRVKAGQYYIFAVCNISPDQETTLLNVSSIDDLRNFKLNWDDKIADDHEMFGVFQIYGDNTESAANDSQFNKDFEEDTPLTITPTTNKIHAWVRRATSKVTIDFDGSGLKDGVTVYIKNARLKDLPKASFLGTTYKVQNKEDLGESKYVITYGSEAGASGGAVITNQITEDSKFNPTTIWEEEAVTSFHADNAPSLPCYENLQGKQTYKSKLQDKDGDGIIDSFDKDDVELGTYLEVEGYYVANRPEYKSEGKIIYRFMLGQDAVNDFNLIRNHHYQITMNFKGYGNDVDWHIVYKEKYLDVSYPQDVNYKGEFFVPDPDYTDPTAWPFTGIPNAGHQFSSDNVISITSFSTGNNGVDKVWVGPNEKDGITYNWSVWDEASSKWIDASDADKDWLSYSISGEPGEGEKDSGRRDYTFKATQSNPTASTIQSLFPSTGGGADAANAVNLGSKETANCYIVDAPGWYSIPLKYGNGETGGGDHFVDHRGEEINNSDILAKYSNVSVKLIWQDAKKLIDPTTDGNLVVDKTNKCIKFKISNIKEGNAVIALIDNTTYTDDLEEGSSVDGKTNGKYLINGNTKAIWSWHIWATPLFSDKIFDGKFQKTIKVTNSSDVENEVMPVNLGWCSGGKNIYYYPPRKCEITFKFGNEEIKREIIQYPHLVLPRGDHPYYQWGRKDPFVGTNTAYCNKKRWINNDLEEKGELNKDNPLRMFNEPAVGEGEEPSNNHDIRKNTVECLKEIIQNPDKWHNSKRSVDPKLVEAKSDHPFQSENVSYPDLWSYEGKKTIYDPCPPGFQVGDNTVFDGFVIQKADYEKNPIYWNDVLENDMFFPSDYPYIKEDVNCHVIEFYTDTRKLQSISFPVSGYRDYDESASVRSYYNPTATTHLNYGSIGFVWTSTAADTKNSYMLKFQRAPISDPETDWAKKDWTKRDPGSLTNEMGIAPKQNYYNTDGFAVRPVKIKKAGEDQEESPPTP